jgi:hypothetical protein
MNSLLKNTLLSALLVAGSVDPAHAETKVPEITQEKAASGKRLSEVLAQAEKQKLDLPKTVAAITYSSRTEFCRAVVDWSENYIDQSIYPDEEDFDFDRGLIPLGIGHGEFFEQVLAPTITKGCLSAKERRAYFEYYKTQALQIYAQRITSLYKRITPYKKDKEKAAIVQKGSEYIKALQIKFESERAIQYEDLFDDGSNSFEVPLASGRYYSDAVKLLEKMEKSPKTLDEITTTLNAYNTLYYSPSLTEEDKADLLKGILLLLDYQIVLINEALPTSTMTSSFVGASGEAVGETEFEAVVTTETRRPFKVPELTLEDEMERTQMYVANDDTYWQRLAELDFYTYAVRDFLLELGDRPKLDPIKQWEKSLAASSKAFAQLPVGRKKSAGIYRTLATHHDDQWVLDSDYDGILLEPGQGDRAFYRAGYRDKFGENPYLHDYTYKYTMVLMSPNACNGEVKGMNRQDSAAWIVSCGFGVGDNLDHVFEKKRVLPEERMARVDQIGGQTADVPLGFIVKLAKEHRAAIDKW